MAFLKRLTQLGLSLDSDRHALLYMLRLARSRGPLVYVGHVPVLSNCLIGRKVDALGYDNSDSHSL